MGRQRGGGGVSGEENAAIVPTPTFQIAVEQSMLAMALADARRPDLPLVFVNDAFVALTGYPRAEILGRNCRFLQGPETDVQEVAQLRQALTESRTIGVDLVNYRRDGTSFWNALYVSPVRDANGAVTHFISMQHDVSDRYRAARTITAQRDEVERRVAERTAQLEAALAAKEVLLHEVDHRVKNNLQMVTALIVMQSRSLPQGPLRQSLQTMLERIEALSTVHRKLYQSDDLTRFDVADFVREIASDVLGASGRRDIEVAFDLVPLHVRAERAAPLALLVNELLTNAIKHGLGEGRRGRLTLSITREPGHATLAVVDDGVGMDGPPRDGFGSRLILLLAEQLQGTARWLPGDPGTRVEIRLPVTTAD